MRVVFCGSGDFACPSLRALLSGPHEIVSIITQPSRPAGRGGKLCQTALAQLADELGLSVDECESVNSDKWLARLEELAADVMVVVDFGQLISLRVRQTMTLGAINLHGSLLPELRGAAPVNWAVIRGYKRTGVTTFSLVDRIDAGPIYAAEATDIEPNETALQLRERLADMGANLLCHTVDMLADGSATATEQDESKATHAPRMRKADGLLDLAADATTVRDLIHGTWPWPGGQSVCRRKGQSDVPVVIARAAVREGMSEPIGSLDADLMIATGKGRLEIIDIRPSGKRLMGWRDFVNGYRIKQGDRFVRPV